MKCPSCGGNIYQLFYSMSKGGLKKLEDGNIRYCPKCGLMRIKIDYDFVTV